MISVESDSRTVLRCVTDNHGEFSDALDQERHALKERMAALQAQQLPACPMDAHNLFLKRFEILNESLCAVQDLLRLVSKYD